MNNNQDSFVYNPQSQTPVDTQSNNTENQQFAKSTPPLQTPTPQLNIIHQQEYANNLNNININNQGAFQSTANNIQEFNNQFTNNINISNNTYNTLNNSIATNNPINIDNNFKST